MDSREYMRQSKTSKHRESSTDWINKLSQMVDKTHKNLEGIDEGSVPNISHSNKHKTRAESIKRINKASLDPRPMSPNVYQKLGTKERFQSPNMSFNVQKNETIDSSGDAKTNLTYEIDPYETIQPKKMYQLGHTSPIVSSLAYKRVRSPQIRPQSYGSRMRSTPNEDKIEWEFNSKFKDLRYEINIMQDTIEDRINKHMRHIEEK